MRIIPVMDLLDGVVVHARKGVREEYQPIKSILCSTASPVEVAKAFYKHFGFDELYIADLDSIQGRDLDSEILRRVSTATPMKIMVDAGINSSEAARQIVDTGASEVIVATETLEDPAQLCEILRNVGSKGIISSLDTKNGRVLSRSSKIRSLTPAKAARMLEGLGVSELIVLELTKVGSESGVDRALVEAVVASVNIPVITGGGVRNIWDVAELGQIGVSGVLLSTALHKGTITSHELDSIENGKASN